MNNWDTASRASEAEGQYFNLWEQKAGCKASAELKKLCAVKKKPVTIQMNEDRFKWR